MMLAELTTLETTALTLGMVFGGLGCLIACVALFRKQEMQLSPQPLTVEVVKALHEQFADKEEFQALVQANTDRHAQLFKTIERVERDGRGALAGEVNKIQADRQRTMEGLNSQFTFIRESLAAINTELKLNRENRHE